MSLIDDMETAYRQVTFGYDEPEAIYANGSEHKRLCRMIGVPEPRDENGLLLADSEVYELTSSGFRLYVC